MSASSLVCFFLLHLCAWALHTVQEGVPTARCAPAPGGVSKRPRGRGRGGTGRKAGGESQAAPQQGQLLGLLLGGVRNIMLRGKWLNWFLSLKRS